MAFDLRWIVSRDAAVRLLHFRPRSLLEFSTATGYTVGKTEKIQIEQHDMIITFSTVNRTNGINLQLVTPNLHGEPGYLLQYSTNFYVISCEIQGTNRDYEYYLQGGSDDDDNGEDDDDDTVKPHQLFISCSRMAACVLLCAALNN